MPATPRNGRSLNDIAYEGIDRLRKTSQTSVGSYASSTSAISQGSTSRMVTPTARRVQLPLTSITGSASVFVSLSSSTPRPGLVTSVSTSQLLGHPLPIVGRPRASSTTSNHSGIVTPSSLLSKSHPPSAINTPGFRPATKSSPSSPSADTPLSSTPTPQRPAPSNAFVTPSSVEYAQTRSLHPLSSSKTARLPFAPNGSPTDAVRPRAATLHPLSHATYQLPTSTSSPIGLKSSLVSKLTPRKAFGIPQPGIGAGGVQRV
jgi:hypothetical protein